MKNLAYEGNESTINNRLAAQSVIFRQQVYKTASNVYTAVGFAIETPVMIEGEDGVILIDPTESYETTAAVMAEFRKITEKPVKAVLYTHHHPDHWGGIMAVVTEQQLRAGEVEIIAHKDFAAGVAKESGMLVDIKTARSLYMYGYLLEKGPEGRVNLGLGPLLANDRQDLVLPTVLVDKEMKRTVCGVRLELYHIPSECRDELCIWMPQTKVLHVAECIQGENYPNLYSIRGSNRDPMTWVKSIDFMRTLPAEYLVGNHMRPVEGAAACAKHMLDYRDMIKYTHDQTVRCINKGMTPDNIVAELDKLPPHLYQRARMGEHYGTFMQAIKMIFSSYIGWFNGDAATLEQMKPADRAERILKLVGRDKLLEECRTALDGRDYKWAAELASVLIVDNSLDKEARGLKAQALKQLGYLTENGPMRNWYLTQAMNLEGGFEAVKKAVPEFNGAGPYVNAMRRLPPDYLMECLAVKLNGPAAFEVERKVRIDFHDLGKSYDISIRGGVLDVFEGGTFEDAALLRIDHMSFVLLFTKYRSVEEIYKAGAISGGLSQQEVETFFSYFDAFTPLFDVEFPFQ